MFLDSVLHRFSRSMALPALSALLLLTAGSAVFAQAPDTAPKRLLGHIPPAVRTAVPVERVNAQETVRFTFALPLRDQAGLDALLKRLYNPADPEYGHYLTPAQFTARFGPTQADYNAVISYARSQGFDVVATHPNRLLLDVTGPAWATERAFRVNMVRYQKPDGELFRSPDAEPSVPAHIAGRLSGIIGLDTAARFHPHNVPLSLNVPQGPIAADGLDPFGLLTPFQIGSGPGGGLTPSDIKAAYNLSGVSLNGTGQTLALFELDGYTASDITAYENAYGLTHTPLQNVLVDGFNGSAGNGAGEVTLDIELMIALAPNATKILVYEGPNSSAGVVDTYNRIATDNLAKQISTSWGLYEAGSGASTRNSENTIFQQMAAQGQSIYAAAGDSGAKDNGSTLSVDDPASQPYMTGVGGTTLTTTAPGGPYVSEKTWNGGSVNAGAGGGGISSVWTIPSYQVGVISAASKGSTTMRNVPDVSLDADPNTGYSIYFHGGWQIYGGTSCAAPLWAGFTALVNQQRATAGKAPLGFANPSLYPIGKGTRYTTDFHDIADGSTNLFYPAVTGFDDATGWGSFNGANLLTDLAGSTGGGGGGGGGGGTASQLLGNPGFENGSSNPSPWAVTAGVIDGSTSEPAHSGTWKAWLDGYGTTHTDSIVQTVTIPSTITTATLTFWLHIDSAETTTTVAYDTLKVQIRNSAGTVLATLATYSNLNKAAGYTQKSFNLAAYKGQTIQVYLVGAEDSSLQTSFVVDDFALNVQ